MPQLRPSLVSRPHLIEKLNQGLDGKLTLISAAAGFGKTTLLSEWVSRNDKAVAWISLDESDNDPIHFLTYFTAALQTIEAIVGEGVMAALQSPRPPATEALLMTLINEISATLDDHAAKARPTQLRRLGMNIILVLDDYHLITAQPVHDILSFLLGHLPVNMHLIIATRSDPPLHLARLRGRGLLNELRETDLRFTLDEAAQFIHLLLGLELSARDLAALTARTEGWIAGLQMAAVSIQSLVPGDDNTSYVSDFIAAFSGSDRYVLDYLVEEVLQSQPDSIQTFLLHTAILDRLSAPLCDAVLGQANAEVEELEEQSIAMSQDMLEDLERANLFIIPLDNERRWYRYHHLFADLLHNQLHKKQTGLELTLHRRASQWFEQEGLIPEAMHHAIATEDFDRAAALLETIVSSLLNESRPATLLSLMSRLPNETIEIRPWLCVHGAWAYFVTWQFDPIEPLLQAVESRLPDIAETQPSQTFADYNRIRSRTVALRAFMAQWQGNLERATSLSYDALKHLDEQDQQLRSVIEMNLGDIGVIEGDLVSARQHLEKSVTAGKAAGNFYAAQSSTSRLAELEAIQGHLHKAAKTFRRAIQLGNEWGEGKPMPGTGRAHVGLARVLYAWNDLNETERHLARGIRLGEQCGEQEIVLEGYLTLARLRQAQGEADAATETLKRAAAIAPREGKIMQTDHVSSWQARIALAQGDLKAATRWADSQGSTLDAPDIPDLRLEERCLTLVRVWIALRKNEEATRVLDQWLLPAEAGGRVGSVIEILILSAVAFQEQSREDRAMASLERALLLAETGGYVRIFVDEGPSVARLLYEAARRGIKPKQTGRLLATFPRLHPKQISQKRRDEIVDPLSERELEVLILIAGGLSNQQISERLFISIATVKWHTSNIYGKLSVKNRTQAVAQARALGILPTS